MVIEKFYRQWKEVKAGWEEVNEEHFREVIGDYYKNINEMIAYSLSGKQTEKRESHHITTDFAFYKVELAETKKKK